MPRRLVTSQAPSLILAAIACIATCENARAVHYPIAGFPIPERSAIRRVGMIEKHEGHDTFTCTATLLDAWNVITAGHCALGGDAKSASFALIGDDGKRSVYPVTRSRSFKGPGAFNDVAILGLASPAGEDALLDSIELDATGPNEGEVVFVTGYGRDEHQRTGRRGTARFEIDGIEEMAKVGQYVEIRGIDSRELAGRPNRPPLVCTGDSGGPVYRMDRDGRVAIVGIVSRHVNGRSYLRELLGPRRYELCEEGDVYKATSVAIHANTLIRWIQELDFLR